MRLPKPMPAPGSGGLASSAMRDCTSSRGARSRCSRSACCWPTGSRLKAPWHEARPLAAPRELDRLARLDLVGVGAVAGAVAREGGRARVGEPDAQSPELQLPDVAQLVNHQVLVDAGAAEEDQMPGGVAVEAPEARHSEEPGRDHEAHAAHVHRLR